MYSSLLNLLKNPNKEFFVILVNVDSWRIEINIMRTVKYENDEYFKLWIWVDSRYQKLRVWFDSTHFFWILIADLWCWPQNSFRWHVRCFNLFKILFKPIIYLFWKIIYPFLLLFYVSFLYFVIANKCNCEYVFFLNFVIKKKIAKYRDF